MIQNQKSQKRKKKEKNNISDKHPQSENFPIKAEEEELVWAHDIQLPRNSVTAATTVCAGNLKEDMIFASNGLLQVLPLSAVRSEEQLLHTLWELPELMNVLGIDSLLYYQSNNCSQCFYQCTHRRRYVCCN